MHPWRRGKQTDYGIHIRETQRLKRFYGLSDRPFRRFLETAERMPGNTGESLLQLLERRIDNVVFLLGLGASRAHCRQLVAHGHVKVNGRRVRVPSILLKPGDRVDVLGRETTQKVVKEQFDLNKQNPVPGWLERKEEPPGGTVLALPRRDEVTFPVDERLVVEFYSR
jgi:small subunit ribosomal protein S4